MSIMWYSKKDVWYENIEIKQWDLNKNNENFTENNDSNSCVSVSYIGRGTGLCSESEHLSGSGQ